MSSFEGVDANEERHGSLHPRADDEFALPDVPLRALVLAQHALDPVRVVEEAAA